MNSEAAPPHLRPPVPNYLVASIFLTLCCCLPLGIPAIVFSAMATSHLAAGNYAAAIDASQKAKLFFWLGLGLGLAVWLGYCALFGIAAIMESVQGG